MTNNDTLTFTDNMNVQLTPIGTGGRSPLTAQSTPSNYNRTANWLQACGKEPGNTSHTSVQVGCHLEEIAEFLETIRTDSEGGELVRTRTIVDLKWLAGKIKGGDYTAHIPTHLRVAALDALCDSEVTGNGIAYLSKFDKQEADKRVMDSNDSKLEGGKPVLLPGGKIGKGMNYRAPDLKDLV